MTAYEWRGAGRVLCADETDESRKRVRGFWFHCDSARGTPVARYLASRGLPWLAGHSDIRYRAETPHPSGVRLPAMIALIHDQHGDIAAAHRTFLTSEGRKADVDPVKATIGAFAGGAIRLDPPGPELVIAEGLETAASAGFILGLPAWAGVACGNVRASLVLPSIVRRVTIAADFDGPGRRAASGAAQRWRAEGLEVRVVQPDRLGQDFNDVLKMRMGMTANA